MNQTPEESWASFCSALTGASAVFHGEGVPKDALTRGEGLRYLSRLTRVALEASVESSDVDFPRLFKLTDDTIKIGGDNPDNIYWNATIAGHREYRISGQRGDVPYLSFGTKANRFAIDGRMASTGELEDHAMAFAADGSFEIIVSRSPHPGNWLPMSDDTSLLLVRQTFLDKSREAPARLSIERIGGPERPAPLDPATVVAQLANAAGFVSATARAFADWTRMFMTHPNAFFPWDQSIFQNVGGDPNIHYLHGYWRLEPGEAWIIETKVPSCRFWNFVLQNWWMESGDYRHIPNAWLNPAKATLGEGGRLVIVVAAEDPRVGNWIDTTGHSEGTALLRWIGAKEHPVPTCKLVRLDELKG